MFNLGFYFCRRGNENVHGWTKDTFALKFDAATRMAYVEKVIDEETKTHKEIQTGYMPQLLDTLHQSSQPKDQKLLADTHQQISII